MSYKRPITDVNDWPPEEIYYGVREFNQVGSLSDIAMVYKEGMVADVALGLKTDELSKVNDIIKGGN